MRAKCPRFRNCGQTQHRGAKSPLGAIARQIAKARRGKRAGRNRGRRRADADELGYLVGSAPFAAHALPSVTVLGFIVATTTFDTMVADLFERSLGIGYGRGGSLLGRLLYLPLLWRCARQARAGAGDALAHSERAAEGDALRTAPENR